MPGSTARSTVSRASRILLTITCLLAALCLIGADAAAATYFVDDARPDESGDGLTWASAKKTIQAAIDASGPGDVILVKYGTYLLTESMLLDSDRRLSSDDGTHQDWDSARPSVFECVLDADSNSRVLTISGENVTAATRIRGFKITGGNATTSSDDPDWARGGGIHVLLGADPTIEACWITDNVAGTQFNGFGGGIACENEGTEVTIADSWFTRNTAVTEHHGYGGGVYAASYAAVTVTDTWFVENLGSVNRTGLGGGIYGERADIVVRSCSFVDNTAAGPASGAGGSGGGIHVWEGTADIGQSAFDGNAAAAAGARLGQGGGIYCSTRHAVIWENTLRENVASRLGPGNGGAIFLQTLDAEVRDNYIRDNVASDSPSDVGEWRRGAGGGIMVSGGSDNHVFRNRLFGNVASSFGDGRGGGIWFNNIAQRIERNLIYENVASEGSPGYGGGIFVNGAGASEVINNTLYGNASQTGGADTGQGSGIFRATGGIPIIRNNAIVGHDVEGSDMLGVYEQDAITIEYNCFYDNPGGNYNAAVTSEHDAVVDPRFTDVTRFDFSLRPDSPLIDAGHPDTLVPENGGWRVDVGAIEYTGTRQVRAIPGPGEYLFGGQVRARVNVVTLGDLTEIEIEVHPGERHPDAPSAVLRWFDIVADAGGGTTFDLTLSYLDSELNAHPEGELYLWRDDGAGWEGPKAPMAADVDENWITVAGQTDFSHWVISGQDITLDAGVSPAIHDLVALPAAVPNPFQHRTTLRFTVRDPGQATLSIFGVNGRRVRMLVEEVLPAGGHTVVWDGRDGEGRPVAPGTYFCRLETARGHALRRVLLVR